MHLNPNGYSFNRVIQIHFMMSGFNNKRFGIKELRIRFKHLIHIFNAIKTNQDIPFPIKATLSIPKFFHILRTKPSMIFNGRFDPIT